METKKIAVACFIGGALCCAIALIFAPIYYWLGLIAGISTGVVSGYVSYEFREVLKAIPIALRAARRGSVYAWDGLLALAKEWFSHQHPFFYLGILLSLFFIIPMSQFIFTPRVVEETGIVGSIMTAIMVWIDALAVFGLLISGLARTGAMNVERCYWQPIWIVADDEREAYIKKLHADGYCEKPLTHLNVLRWTVFGIAVTILFFTWTLWKYLAIAVWATICFLGRFAWHLFKLIHSQKRVLCAIDGTLGGVASYIWLASSATSFAEQVVLVIFGGLLGAAFGVANWEIVSKRILHVAHVSNA